MSAPARKRPFHKRDEELDRYINLKLAALGQPVSRSTAGSDFLEIAGPLLRNYYQKDRQLGNWLCASDSRIQDFLDAYLSDVCPQGAARLPANTFVLDREGMARVLSLPVTADSFSSPYLDSYRLPQGVLHNPRSDRRTTQGLFHIAEGGFPVPADKAAVPKQAFAALWSAALRPPDGSADPAVHGRSGRDGALLRLAAAAAAGLSGRRQRSGEDHGDPLLRARQPGQQSRFRGEHLRQRRRSVSAGKRCRARCDALDRTHRLRHAGAAPRGHSEEGAGLPHVSEATERQRRDGMCWTDEAEPYNDGRAFKVACRDARGVMVTIIADNYFGYCKKEVKTQISFAANLYGSCEEEHAGGALAFATYVLGQDFYADRTVSLKVASFDDAMNLLGDLVELQPEGYAVDQRYPNIYYVPENASFHMREGFVRWPHGDGESRLPLRAGAVYVLPNGFRVKLQKQLAGTAWRLVGSRPRGTLCHKPCTVSGGGKSEISKSIADVLLKGPVFVKDYHRDMDQVAEILDQGFLRHLSQPAARRALAAADSEPGALARLGDPAADAVARVHRRSTTPGRASFRRPCANWSSP